MGSRFTRLRPQLRGLPGKPESACGVAAGLQLLDVVLARYTSTSRAALQARADARRSAVFPDPGERVPFDGLAVAELTASSFVSS